MHRKVYSDLQKEKEIQISVGIMIKNEKRSGTTQKDYH